MAFKATLTFNEETSVVAAIDSDDIVSITLQDDENTVTLRFENGSWENVASNVDIVLYGDEQANGDSDEE